MVVCILLWGHQFHSWVEMETCSYGGRIFCCLPEMHFISYRKNRWRKEKTILSQKCFCWELKKLRVCTYHVMFGYNTAALCRVTSHAKTIEPESSNWNKCNTSENMNVSTCTETDKHSNTNHWLNPTECTFLHQSFGAILRFVRWRPVASGMDAPVQG